MPANTSWNVSKELPFRPAWPIGEALVMDNEGFRIPRRFVARDAVDDELERLDKAIVGRRRRNRPQSRGASPRELGEQYGAIFAAHLQMLRDRRLRSELEDMIRERHYSPEYAVSRALRRYAKVFQSIESSYLAERANDIFDIEKRLLRHLLGRRREELVAPHLAGAGAGPQPHAQRNGQSRPRSSSAASSPRSAGPAATPRSWPKALEIPAVVGTGPFLTDVSGGDVVIIDGDQGLVILQPDEETLARYRHEAEQNSLAAVQLGAAPRSARRNRRRRARSNCSATSSSPTR